MPYMAVQCFSCHHMQVKEVRKSSSSGRKWSCAICNEKQSVRKVFSSADTAKDVRKFVQRFNLSAGQAAHAEIVSRLESGSPTQDSSYDYCHQEDEEGNMDGTTGAYAYAGQKKSKWDKYLPNEEKLCSGDACQQSPDDTRFTTTLPEPVSRKRMRPNSSSSPPNRPSRGFSASGEYTHPEQGSFIPSDSMKSLIDHSPSDNSWKFQKGKGSGSEYGTPLGRSTWKMSTLPESPLDSDGLQNSVKSCHAQVSQVESSKWSKYLS